MQNNNVPLLKQSGMIHNPGFKGSRVLIMGLGRFGGGIGAAKFFAEEGASVTVTDLKPASRLSGSLERIRDLDITLHLGGHAEEDFKQADIVCVSPAVKPGSRFLKTASDNGARIVTEMGLFFEMFPGRIVGITGTNGKSTTAALTAEMMKTCGHIHAGGNMGISLLPRIGTFTAEDTAVLELSSYQLYRLDHLLRSPETAVITNISPNHLDWHADWEEYTRCKSVIVKYQKESDTVVYNGKDADAAEIASGTAGTCIRVDAEGEEGIFLNGNDVVFSAGEDRAVLFSRNDLRLQGMCNLQNAMCAAGAAFAEGASSEDIRSAVRNFTGLPHRLELVGRIDGIAFYDDSVSTTPESTEAATEAMAGNSVFILGGYDKGIDLAPAVQAVVSRCTGAVCIGDTGERLFTYAVHLGEGSGFSAERADSLEEAVEQSIEIVRHKGNGSVVLSPGCASYDMFEDFEDRGQAFAQIVHSLRKEEQ